MRALLNSLRVRLILLVLLSAVPALGLTFYSGIEQRRQARLDAFRQALDLAKKTSDDQEHLIERTHQLLVTLAQMPQVLQCRSSGDSPFLARFLKEDPFYANFGTTGPDGRVHCSALAMKQPVNFADREWFPRILHTRKFTVSEYIIGRITGKPIIVLSYPILAGTDDLKAVIFAALDLDWLNQIIAKTQIPPGSVLMVLDRRGTILARYPDPEKWIGRNMSDTPIIKTILTRRGDGTAEMLDFDSVPRLYGFAPLSDRAEVGAYVAVGIPSTVAFAEANRILSRNLALLVLASILALVAAWWFGGLFVLDPMNRLLNTTKRLADGDLTIRTGSSYPRGEIGQLASAFDQMAESLEQREAERKQAEEALRRSEEETSRLAQENAHLVEIGQIISSTLDIEEVYESFAKEALKLITFDRISINLINLEEGKAVVSYVAGLDIPGRRFGETFLLKGSVIEQIRVDRLGMLIQPETREQLEGEFPKFIPHFQAGLRSMMGVPLIYGDAVIGVLYLYSTELKAYTERDLRLAERIANQIAGAIANAQLFLERKRAEEVLGKTEERFRDLYDSAPVGYHEYDTEGRITNVNRTDLEMLGYSPEEMIGQYMWKFNLEEDIAREQILEKLAGLRPPGRSLERTYRRKDGTTFPVLIEDRLNQDEAGRITGIRCTIQDITERKEMEEALRESETEAKRLAAETEVLAKIGRVISSTLNTDEVYELFAEEVRKVLPFDLMGVVLIDRERNTATVTYITGVPVRERGAKECFPLAGSLTEESLRNREGIILHPQSEDEVAGRFPGVLPSFRSGLRSMMMVPLISKDRTIGALHFNAMKPQAYTPDDLRLGLRVGNQIAGAIANFQLFLERERAEEALRKSEGRYKRITEGLTDYQYTVRVEDGRAVETRQGPACATVTGYTAEEFAADPYLWIQMVAPEDREQVQERVQRILAGNEIAPMEHRIVRKDGETRWVRDTVIMNKEAAGKLLSYDGVIKDITDRKRAEEEKAKLEAQLQQAQKMEAIGTLAGGIAHDFNNILSGIMGYVELAGMDISENSRAKYNLQQSIKACHRAKDLVQQILTLSRQGKQERKLLNINPIIKEALKFLRASLPATIEIRQDIEEDLGTIEADPTQVHQVLTNLCTNAAHAMGENGGVLGVSLSKWNVDGETSAAAAGIEAGPYLRLRVSDTGHGMPPEIRERIFEPYFTTKEVGKGTGLGLAVVHGIVKSYGGEITVSSEAGKGSTFDIYFPTIDTPKEIAASFKRESLPAGGHERILFVDDEQSLVEVGQGMLTYLGYRVTVRTSSIEALELFRAKPDQFDLVITDMTMPNMMGDKLAGELTRIRPDIPIILCTGFSEYITKEKAQSIGIRELLLKPIVMTDLTRVVRQVIDQSKGEG